MGLFGNKEMCCICGNNSGSHKIADGRICKECLQKAFGYFKDATWLSKKSKQDVITAIEASNGNKQLLQAFSATSKIGKYLELDKTNRLWKVPSIGRKDNPKIFKYSDLISFDLVVDESVIQKSGLGKAAAGGLLFGGAGAIVGGIAGKKSLNAAKSIALRVSTHDDVFQSFSIFLLTQEAKKGSLLYSAAMASANQLISAFELIDAEKQPSQSASFSAADEIKKFKELLDSGAITQEEFDAKKKQLLGL